MALIFRLAGKKIGSGFLKNEKSRLLSFVRPLSHGSVESYDERNMKIKRPQSPHLTIYSPQLTTLLSISQRISGMTLSAYVISLGLGAVVLPDTIPEYIEAFECLELDQIIIYVLKYALAFPLAYHFWNGIRHLIWDMGLCLSIKQVYITGYLMLLLVFASASLLSIM